MSILWENNHKKTSSQKARSKGSQHDQKKRVIVLTSKQRQTVGMVNLHYIQYNPHCSLYMVHCSLYTVQQVGEGKSQYASTGAYSNTLDKCHWPKKYYEKCYEIRN